MATMNNPLNMSAGLIHMNFEHLDDYAKEDTFDSLNSRFGTVASREEDNGVVQTAETTAQWARIFMCCCDTEYEDRLKFTILRYRKIVHARSDQLYAVPENGELHNKLSAIDKPLFELRKLIYENRESSKHCCSLYAFQHTLIMHRMPMSPASKSIAHCRTASAMGGRPGVDCAVIEAQVSCQCRGDLALCHWGDIGARSQRGRRARQINPNSL